MAAPPNMPPQPSGALDHQVDRREVRDHQIEVEVEALFYNLRCNEYPTVPHLGAPRAAEGTHNFGFDALAVEHGEARVEEQRLKSRRTQRSQAAIASSTLLRTKATRAPACAAVTTREGRFKIADLGGGHEARKTIANGLGHLVWCCRVQRW